MPPAPPPYGSPFGQPPVQEQFSQGQFGQGQYGQGQYGQGQYGQGQYGQGQYGQGQFGQLQSGQPQYGQPQAQGQFGGQPAWAGGSPSRPGGSVNLKAVNPMDWGIIACGVLAFLFSFAPFYTASVNVAGYGRASVHGSAWHGFFGWFGVLCALVGAAVTAALIFAPQVRLRAPNRLVAAGAFALATVCLLLALVLVPIDTSGVSGINKGHGWGYWIDLLLVIIGLVLALMRLLATGGSLPWQKKRAGSGQGGGSGQAGLSGSTGGPGQGGFSDSTGGQSGPGGFGGATGGQGQGGWSSQGVSGQSGWDGHSGVTNQGGQSSWDAHANQTGQPGQANQGGPGQGNQSGGFPS